MLIAFKSVLLDVEPCTQARDMLCNQRQHEVSLGNVERGERRARMPRPRLCNADYSLTKFDTLVTSAFCGSV